MLQAVLGEIKHNNINNKYNNTGFNYHTDPGYLSYTIDYTLHTSIFQYIGCNQCTSGNIQYEIEIYNVEFEVGLKMPANSMSL